MDDTFQKILDENNRLWKQINHANNKDRDTRKDSTTHILNFDSFQEPEKGIKGDSRIISPKSKSPFQEEEVKLEEKLKEIERKRNKSKNELPGKPKVEENKQYKGIKNIENNWKPLKNRLIDIGVFDKDKTLNLFSEELEKSISISLEKEGLGNKDIQIDHLTKQVIELKADLKKAYNKINEYERQANNEDELNKILNSSFGCSDHKSLSFYGVPTREAKSPVLPRNLTHMKGPQKPLDMAEPYDKVQESLSYYKYKLRILQKNYDNLKEKHQKINKRTKELYALNEKLINALKAQKSFEKLSGDKKTVKCKNCGEKVSVVMSNMSNSMDRINIKAENASFMFCSSGLGHHSPTVGVSPRFNNQEDFIYSPKSKVKPKVGKDSIEFRTKVVNNDGKYVKRPKKRRNNDNRSRTADPFS